MQRFQVVLELAQLLGSQAAQALLGSKSLENVLGLQPTQAFLGRSLVEHRLLFFRRQAVQKLLAQVANILFDRRGHAWILRVHHDQPDRRSPQKSTLKPAA